MSDNNRGIHAGSYAGDSTNAEGIVPNTLDFKNGRQAVADRDLHNDGVYNAASAVSGTEKFLSQADEAGESSLHDDNYPNLPGPVLPGAAGTTNAGPQGSPVDFNSVAPYEYPEFPKDSYKSGGGSAAIPYT